jgi:hypothetical protein
VAEGGVNLVEEFNAEAFDASVVPLSSLAVLFVSLVLESDEHSSVLPQGCFGAGAHIVPGNTLGLTSHDPSGAPFDLLGPSLLHGGRILDARAIEAGQ